MAKGRKTGGRKPGSVNRVTRTVKEVFEATFKQLQADPTAPHALANWAEREPSEFYKLAAKLIPSEIKGQMEHNHKVPSLDVVASALGIKKSG